MRKHRIAKRRIVGGCFTLFVVALLIGCAAQPRSWYPSDMSSDQVDELRQAHRDISLQQPF